MKATGIGSKALLTLALILLISNGAHALDTCQCNLEVLEFTFINDKSSIQHYSIQKSGSAGTWATITPGFALAPGDSKTVVAIVSVPCNALPGVYELELKAVSQAGAVTQKKSLSVSTCHSFDLITSKAEYDVCVNGELKIPVSVTNTGKFEESVMITSSQGLLSDTNFILGVNDTKVLNLTLNPELINTTQVTLNAVSDSFQVSKVLTVNGIKCTEFDASIINNYVTLCENEDKELKLRITNYNYTSITVKLSTGSSFIELPLEVDLSSREIREVSVKIHGTCDRDVINPVINLWAPGSDNKVIPLTVNLRNCYQPIVVAGLKSDRVCACENITYSYTLYNPGGKSVTYALSSSRGLIYDKSGSVINSITLSPDSQAELKIKSTLNCDESGVIPVTLKAVGVYVCNKTSEDAVTLDVASWSSCQAVSVNSPDSIVFNKSSQVVVPVSVSNIGRRPTSYNIQVGGNAMQYLVGMSTGFLTLNPGEMKTVELTFTPHNSSDYAVIVTALSLDNLASDSKTVSLVNSEYVFTFDFYYLIIPAAVVVLLVTYLLRGSKVKPKKASVKSRK